MDSGPLELAVGLPQSPAGAIGFILVVLAVTYAILRILVRTEQPFSPDDYTAEDSEAGDSGVPAIAETQSGDRTEFFEEPAVPEPQIRVEKAIVVQSVSIWGQHVSTGDAAGTVMRAVKRNESAAMPVIDRHLSGYAVRVMRRYRSTGQELTLVFQRGDVSEVLRLVEIGLNTG